MNKNTWQDNLQYQCGKPFVFDKSAIEEKTNFMRDIVKNHLASLQVNYFTYDTNFFDNSHSRLTTHSDWIKQYYSLKLYDHAIFEKDLLSFQDGYLLWDWINPCPVYSEASNFNIANGLTVIRKYSTHNAYYHFGFNNSVDLHSAAFVNIMEKIENFIGLFHGRYADLIELSNNNRIVVLSQSNKKPSLQISPQDRQILYLMQQGFKYHDISRIIPMSERTIEEHIKRLKKTFQCDNLFALGVVLARKNIL